MDDLARWMKVVCAGMQACVGLAALAADPMVSNVRVAQRAGTGRLDITYDLFDADTTNLYINVNISTNNGVSWFVPAASNLTGAVGINAVSTGKDRSIVWQGGRELPARLFPSVNAKITADDTPPLYLVINLSGGTNAASYPVTCYASNDVPGGASSDAYKTTNLLMRLISKMDRDLMMGSPDGELGHSADEMQHSVRLTKDFYIGVFEVTQRQWELVMGNKPSYFTNATYYARRPVEQVSYYDIRENTNNSDDAVVNWPANSAVNATSFMGKLRSKTGLTTFDLPTESQWEYACRAGTTSALNIGQQLTSTSSDAQMGTVGRYWYNGGSGGYNTPNGSTSVGTAKVGTYYYSNAWGLYDMHGNVWEWCLDWYGTYSTYPYAERDPAGAASGSSRVFRGGDWIDSAGVCRSASRGCFTPNYRFSNVGFRVARTLP